MLIVLCLGNLADIYAVGVGADDLLTKAFIGFSFIFYVAELSGLGFGASLLGQKLGFVAVMPSIVGMLILAYASYCDLPLLFGLNPRIS
ncbi:hypothetical protein ACVIIV_003038 [Bradyrhizobium sp. USDA 4354]